MDKTDPGTWREPIAIVSGSADRAVSCSFKSVLFDFPSCCVSVDQLAHVFWAVISCAAFARLFDRGNVVLQHKNSFLLHIYIPGFVLSFMSKCQTEKRMFSNGVFANHLDQ